MLKKEYVEFRPVQAEDYCFAYFFGFISEEDGERRWPALRGHESDRIEECRKTLRELKCLEEIASKDHRVIQAAVMWANVTDQLKPEVIYPYCVNKTWPQFWEFIKYSKQFKK